jgi:hypothetical protein
VWEILAAGRRENAPGPTRDYRQRRTITFAAVSERYHRSGRPDVFVRGSHPITPDMLTELQEKEQADLAQSGDSIRLTPPNKCSWRMISDKDN